MARLTPRGADRRPIAGDVTMRFDAFVLALQSFFDSYIEAKNKNKSLQMDSRISAAGLGYKLTPRATFFLEIFFFHLVGCFLVFLVFFSFFSVVGGVFLFIFIFIFNPTVPDFSHLISCLFLSHIF